MFGSYPTDDEFALLISEGYSTILDLCPSDEITWQPYDKTNINYLHYPIPDRTPTVGNIDLFRTQIITNLVDQVKAGHKVYLHCRGGHGRSALVAAIVYGYFLQCSGEEALQAVKVAHQLRTEMAEDGGTSDSCSKTFCSQRA